MVQAQKPFILDCTLRDGGYYNAWDFSPTLVEEYLAAMKAAKVDVVELGFRLLSNQGFKGACAYTTDEYLESIAIPNGLTIGVMVNGSDLCTTIGCEPALKQLFPNSSSATPVELVRIACHFHELQDALPATAWLSDRGYRVGINLMQIADRTHEEICEFARMANLWPIEVLYFADSLGSLSPSDIARITGWLREGWIGSLGIHAHDNMGLALQNTLRAHAEGVTWLDSTVTGMGRGPGNARTEELVIEAEALRGMQANLVPLMTLITRHFAPMKQQYNWGSNPYYYLAGKHGIHPSFIQAMLNDSRFLEEDILAVIDHLRISGGERFSITTLESARHFYCGTPRGTWRPASVLADREVVILGTGPGVAAHSNALEAYIDRARPLVIALNTQSSIDPELIDLRIACHPVRLLADVDTHARLPQPLITPASMLPESLRAELGNKELLDYGLGIEPGRFEFHDSHCIAPTSLVLAYALAVATSGKSARILMAGFDGYSGDDKRNDETDEILNAYSLHGNEEKLISITPTRYRLRSASVYASTL